MLQVWRLLGHTGSSVVMWSLEGQLIRTDGDRGVSLRPLSDWENLLWRLFFLLLHCWPSVLSSCWAEHWHITPTTSLLRELTKHYFYSLPSYSGQEMIQDHSHMQETFSDSVGFAWRHSALENRRSVWGQLPVLTLTEAEAVFRSTNVFGVKKVPVDPFGFIKESFRFLRHFKREERITLCIY